MEPLKIRFNYKVVEYPNGTVQVRHYDKAIIKTDDLSDYEEYAFGQESELIINPFDYNPTEQVSILKSNKKRVLSDEEKQINSFRNFSRCKQQIFTYARCVPWEWFVTVTFNKEKVDRSNFDDCSKKLRKWLNNQRRNSPDLKYLFVPELHEDGKNWHFHGLMADTGNIKFVDSGHRDKKGNEIYNMIKWQYGFTSATKVKDINKVSKYIGKYITKTVFDLSDGRHRYYISKNIEQPKISTYLFEDVWDVDNVVDMIADKINKKIVHVSHSKYDNAYTKVDYFELQ